MSVSCPDCDFSHEKSGVVFTHRVKKHTNSGDGDSFNLYEDEIFDIYVDMSIQEARRRVEERGEEPTIEKVEYELGEMGVSTGVKESLIERNR